MPTTDPQLQKIDTMVNAIMTLSYEEHDKNAAAPAFAEAFTALQDELSSLKVKAPQAYMELKARAEQELQMLGTTVQIAHATAHHFIT